MSLAPLLLVAFIIATISIVRNRKVTRDYSRKSFIIIFLLVSAPALYVVASDLTLLQKGDRLPFSESVTQFMYLYFLFASYPFYQRVCWRANDANAPVAAIYGSLVPYINVLIFIYLCIKPTKEQLTGNSEEDYL